MKTIHIRRAALVFVLFAFASLWILGGLRPDIQTDASWLLAASVPRETVCEPDKQDAPRSWMGMQRSRQGLLALSAALPGSWQSAKWSGLPCSAMRPGAGGPSRRVNPLALHAGNLAPPSLRA